MKSTLRERLLERNRGRRRSLLEHRNRRPLLERNKGGVKTLLEEFEDELLSASQQVEPVVVTDLSPEELEDYGVSEMVLFVTGINDEQVEAFLNDFEQLLSKYSAVSTDAEVPPPDLNAGIPTPIPSPTPENEVPVETEYSIIAGTGEGAEESLPSTQGEEELAAQEGVKILTKKILEMRKRNKSKRSRK